MTRRAIQVRRNSRGVIKRLAGCDTGAMAKCAVSVVYAQVIKHCRGKVSSVMARGTILVDGNSRYVINQPTHADITVVAGHATTNNTSMIIAASGKGTRAVAITTIEGIPNWYLNPHVIEFHGECGRTMAGIAPDREDSGVGMIDKCAFKSLGVMAITTIGSGCRVGEHRG